MLSIILRPPYNRIQLCTQHNQWFWFDFDLLNLFIYAEEQVAKPETQGKATVYCAFK